MMDTMVSILSEILSVPNAHGETVPTRRQDRQDSMHHRYSGTGPGSSIYPVLPVGGEKKKEGCRFGTDRISDRISKDPVGPVGILGGVL